MQLDSAPETYLDANIAKETLSGALRNGSLSLFVGAGISRSTTRGFPDWVSLVKRCCDEKGVDFNARKKGSNTYLRKCMETVERKCAKQEFLSLVGTKLYQNVQYDIQLMRTDLLVALGALVMTSVRGGARAVVNYNFDDLLEWYLGYHGFTLDIVSRFPALTTRSDVQVYHPHGFLPHMPKFNDLKTNTVILTEKSYQLAISSEVNPWNEFQRSLMGSTLGLFVGLSGDDPHIDNLCNKVYEQIISKKRILGFILLLDTPTNRQDEQHRLARGLIPMYIQKYADLPTVMLNICQLAAEL